jgi:hypothetical protein
MESVVGKNASYMNIRGRISESWKLKEGMTLVKIVLGDSTYAVLNVDVVKIE